MSIEAVRHHFDIVIVGGGASGALLAIHLLESSSGAIKIAIMNADGLPGRGVAYGTTCDMHLLNVKADKMSAFPNDPDHFLRWATRVCGFPAPAQHFLPRRLYGRYIEHTLQQSLMDHPDASLTWVSSAVTGIGLGLLRPHVSFSGNLSVEAEAIVLATGNTRSSLPPELESVKTRVYEAWDPRALEGIPRAGRVLIVGSGLTAVDHIIALTARRFEGEIIVLSRHGRIPEKHIESCVWSSDWTDKLPKSICGLLASVRQEIRRANAVGVDWRAVIDSMRASNSLIWQALPICERKRFVRHLRPFWETVRHRLPPASYDQLHDLLHKGVVQIRAGRLLGADEVNGRVAVTYRDRSAGHEESTEVDRIFNCTGPAAHSRAERTLTQELVSEGLACLDPLEIGIETSPEGALVSACGGHSHVLYAIGPVRKASLWETTAIPEIRMQAMRLAAHLLRILDNPPGSTCTQDHAASSNLRESSPHSADSAST